MRPALRCIGDYDRELMPRADLCLCLNSAALRGWHQGPRLTDYVSRYSMGLLEGRVASIELSEIAAGLSFAISELLENVAKFASDDSVDIRVDTSGSELILSVENALDSTAASSFAQRVELIVDGDPLTMMLEQVEARAEQPEVSGSGLGFLTLINDYGARLGWCFAPVDDDAQMWRVAIMVRFAFNEDLESGSASSGPFQEHAP